MNARVGRETPETKQGGTETGLSHFGARFLSIVVVRCRAGRKKTKQNKKDKNSKKE